MTDEADSSSTTTDSTDKRGRTLGWIGAIFGAVGAISGLAGVVISWNSQRELNQASLHVVAAVSASDYTQQGFGVRVALINRGLGGTTVTEARLLVDGRPIATATGWVRDPRIFSSSLPYRSNVKRELLEDVTVRVGGRSARSVGFVFPLDRCPEGTPADKAVNGAIKLACTVAACTSGTCPSPQRFAVRLKVSPGKDHEADLDVRPQVRRFAGWKPSVARRAGAVTALKIRRVGTNDPTVSEVVSLELWPVASGASPRVLSRPVVGRATALYPIGDLPRGRYVWAFLTHNRPLISGTVRIPCLRCTSPLTAVRGQVGPRETASGLPAAAPPPPKPPTAPRRSPPPPTQGSVPTPQVSVATPVG